MNCKYFDIALFINMNILLMSLTWTELVILRWVEQKKKRPFTRFLCALVTYVWRACQRQCVVVVWGWDPAQWSSAVLSKCVPIVTLGQWCWQWLVTMSKLLSPPSIPPIPCSLCSTFIWPHLQPLAFNAELGSPLIKVTAFKRLT